jgi:hypothetical protein
VLPVKSPCCAQPQSVSKYCAQVPNLALASHFFSDLGVGGPAFGRKFFPEKRFGPDLKHEFRHGKKPIDEIQSLPGRNFAD